MADPQPQQPDLPIGEAGALQDEPLGLKRPLLPPPALGSNPLQPKFLKPLGAKPIAGFNFSTFFPQGLGNYRSAINQFDDFPFTEDYAAPEGNEAPAETGRSTGPSPSPAPAPSIPAQAKVTDSFPSMTAPPPPETRPDPPISFDPDSFDVASEINAPDVTNLASDSIRTDPEPSRPMAPSTSEPAAQASSPPVQAASASPLPTPPVTAPKPTIAASPPTVGPVQAPIQQAPAQITPPEAVLTAAPGDLNAPAPIQENTIPPHASAVAATLPDNYPVAPDSNPPDEIQAKTDPSPSIAAFGPDIFDSENFTTDRFETDRFAPSTPEPPTAATTELSAHPPTSSASSSAPLESSGSNAIPPVQAAPEPVVPNWETAPSWTETSDRPVPPSPPPELITQQAVNPDDTAGSSPTQPTEADSSVIDPASMSTSPINPIQAKSAPQPTEESIDWATDDTFLTESNPIDQASNIPTSEAKTAPNNPVASPIQTALDNSQATDYNTSQASNYDTTSADIEAIQSATAIPDITAIGSNPLNPQPESETYDSATDPALSNQNWVVQPAIEPPSLQAPDRAADEDIQVDISVPEIPTYANSSTDFTSKDSPSTTVPAIPIQPATSTSVASSNVTQPAATPTPSASQPTSTIGSWLRRLFTRQPSTSGGNPAAQPSAPTPSSPPPPIPPTPVQAATTPPPTPTSKPAETRSTEQPMSSERVSATEQAASFSTTSVTPDQAMQAAAAQPSINAPIPSIPLSNTEAAFTEELVAASGGQPPLEPPTPPSTDIPLAEPPSEPISSEMLNHSAATDATQNVPLQRQVDNSVIQEAEAEIASETTDFSTSDQPDSYTEEPIIENSLAETNATDFSDNFPTIVQKSADSIPLEATADTTKNISTSPTIEPASSPQTEPNQEFEGRETSIDNLIDSVTSNFTTSDFATEDQSTATTPDPIVATGIQRAAEPSPSSSVDSSPTDPPTPIQAAQDLISPNAAIEDTTNHFPPFPAQDNEPSIPTEANLETSLPEATSTVDESPDIPDIASIQRQVETASQVPTSRNTNPLAAVETSASFDPSDAVADSFNDVADFVTPDSASEFSASDRSEFSGPDQSPPLNEFTTPIQQAEETLNSNSFEPVGSELTATDLSSTEVSSSLDRPYQASMSGPEALTEFSSDLDGADPLDGHGETAHSTPSIQTSIQAKADVPTASLSQDSSPDSGNLSAPNSMQAAAWDMARTSLPEGNNQSTDDVAIEVNPTASESADYPAHFDNINDTSSIPSVQQLSTDINAGSDFNSSMSALESLTSDDSDSATADPHPDLYSSDSVVDYVVDSTSDQALADFSSSVDGGDTASDNPSIVNSTSSIQRAIQPSIEQWDPEPDPIEPTTSTEQSTLPDPANSTNAIQQFAPPTDESLDAQTEVTSESNTALDATGNSDPQAAIQSFTDPTSLASDTNDGEGSPSIPAIPADLLSHSGESTESTSDVLAEISGDTETSSPPVELPSIQAFIDPDLTEEIADAQPDVSLKGSSQTNTSVDHTDSQAAIQSFTDSTHPSETISTEDASSITEIPADLISASGNFTESMPDVSTETRPTDVEASLTHVELPSIQAFVDPDLTEEIANSQPDIAPENNETFNTTTDPAATGTAIQSFTDPTSPSSGIDDPDNLNDISDSLADLIPGYGDFPESTPDISVAAAGDTAETTIEPPTSLSTSPVQRWVDSNWIDNHSEETAATIGETNSNTIPETGTGLVQRAQAAAHPAPESISSSTASIGNPGAISGGETGATDNRTVAQLLADGALPQVPQVIQTLGHWHPLGEEPTGSKSDRTEPAAPEFSPPPPPQGPDLPLDLDGIPDSWSSIEELLSGSIPPAAAPSPGSRSFSPALPVQQSRTPVSPLPVVQRSKQPDSTVEDFEFTVQAPEVQSHSFEPGTPMSGYAPIQASPDPAVSPEADNPAHVEFSDMVKFKDAISNQSPSVDAEAGAQMTTIVSQAVKEELTPEQRTEEFVNLEFLAREIYGLLRQRLEVERERHGKLYRSDRLL